MEHSPVSCGRAEAGLDAKAARLREILAGLGSVGVAFSGGVDSSLVLAVARDVLGRERTLALTAHSELIPAAEREGAARIAQQLGVRHIVLELRVLDDPGIAANRPDRCYHCKRAVFGALQARALAEGMAALVHGANLDDIGDYRPGARAAEELGVRAPLQEAGFTKADVRALSRRMGLPTWDLPSMACLASRVPYDTPLDEAVLARVDEAEAFLRAQFGLRQLRVRDHFPLARIEVPEEEIERLAQPQVRQAVVERLRALGYRYVTLDLAGFRSGSMNEVIGHS